uniref:Serpin domain-containing protein n=1 Tax=Eptatretus burgeri TaxID=7764 RepID=A0A8C4Q248_EPTBU
MQLFLVHGFVTLLLTAAVSARAKDSSRMQVQQLQNDDNILQSLFIKDLAMTQANFGFDLYRGIASKRPGENLFMSPLTTSVALSMLSIGEWKYQFDTKHTTPQLFHQNTENASQVPMMFHKRYSVKLGYLHSQDQEMLNCMILQIFFKHGKSLVIFLPDEITTNLTALESILTAKLVNDQIQNNLMKTEIRLYLPKFKLESQQDLVPSLSELGLGELFTSADLHKISDEPLVVSAVKHRAAIEIAEEGAEASAATVVIHTRSGLSVTEVRVDRPFLFLIRDDTNKAVLFIGRYMLPEGPTISVQKSRLPDIHLEELDIIES